MKRILLSLIAFVLCQGLSAQKLDSLYGKWNFAEVYIAPGDSVDSLGQEMAKKMFESMSVTFKKDGKATLNMFNKAEDASFVYKEKKKTFVVTTNSGKKVNIEIVAFQGSRMAIIISGKMKFWMKRE